MKSRIFYIIVPIVLMVAFLFFHGSEKQRIIADDAAKKIAKEADEARLAREKADLRAKALVEADKRDAARKEEEDKKRQDKKDAFDKLIKGIETERDRFTADLNQYKQESADLEKELDALRGKRQDVSRRLIEMNKEIAQAMIARNNAELEVHRYAEMVAQKANDSSLTKLPPPPTTAAK
jgi:chromosome segregation ATPase